MRYRFRRRQNEYRNKSRDRTVIWVSQIFSKFPIMWCKYPGTLRLSKNIPAITWPWTPPHHLSLTTTVNHSLRSLIEIYVFGFKHSCIPDWFPLPGRVKTDDETLLGWQRDKAVRGRSLHSFILFYFFTVIKWWNIEIDLHNIN